MLTLETKRGSGSILPRYGVLFIPPPHIWSTYAASPPAFEKGHFPVASAPFVQTVARFRSAFPPPDAKKRVKPRIFMFTCAHAVRVPWRFFPFFRFFAAGATPPRLPPSPPLFAATAPAPVPHRRESRSPALRPTRSPRSPPSSSRVCSSSLLRSRSPKTLRLPRRSAPRRSPSPRRSRRAASSLTPASKAPAPRRSIQARPARIFSRTTRCSPSFPRKNLPCIRLHERMSGEV